jgi:hypothetical protein
MIKSLSLCSILDMEQYTNLVLLVICGSWFSQGCFFVCARPLIFVDFIWFSTITLAPHPNVVSVSCNSVCIYIHTHKILSLQGGED